MTGEKPVASQEEIEVLEKAADKAAKMAESGEGEESASSGQPKEIAPGSLSKNELQKIIDKLKETN